MTDIRQIFGATLLLVPLATLSCGSPSADEPADSDEVVDSGGDSDDPTASWDDARPIIEAHCARCHSADRLSTYRRLETHAEVTALRTSILDKIGDDPPRGQRMPLASNHTDAGGCTPTHPQLNDKRLSEGDKQILRDFLLREDHRDYVDEYAPLAAPEVPLLANTVAYTSSQFDVLNDGFLTDPDGQHDDYMDKYGYDQREYDQMEDDWFCIRFNPARTEAGYLTGAQILTDSGQIYLSSQLVIDTQGSSAAAHSAAAESGSDWYRCDAGLGFNDGLELWRTVPGGDAIELPEGVGLAFQPGWTFVLRADFHTHYDADEFNRLEQDGVIDYQNGTMTWRNRATLRARWGTSQDVSRELQSIRIEPTTQAERDGFAVVPGESTLSYQAAVPADANTSYALFSAEVGMGKNGYAASLVDSSTGTCMTSNTDFSPKWIEQAIYGEEDAPTLSDSSVLDLRCDYRNGTTDPVTWGPEGEATVWGRRDRCSAQVFYYEAL